MKKDVDRIIGRIARKQKISKEEVLEDMRIAIDAGYNSPDPAVRAAWSKMPFQGKPTPQEFIFYMAQQLEQDRDPVFYF